MKALLPEAAVFSNSAVLNVDDMPRTLLLYIHMRSRHVLSVDCLRLKLARI